MVDIAKQIAFWRDSAKEDWDVARQLLDNGRTRHGLFFAHLALEKMLKAIVCKQSQDLAPRLHNLSRLADLASLTPNQGKMEVLAEMNAFHIEGRYPESLAKAPTKEEALNYMARAEGVYQWLMNQS
ncbi:MAG: HEPN domain-containing protein [Deltaproteobacteria bacterium]|nr:HEPN domain-containing protein [Deltaproteobacteria bacterium]